MKHTFLKFPPRMNVWHSLPDGTRVMKGRRAGVRDQSTCFLEKAEYDELVIKLGKDAAEKIKSDMATAEKAINDKLEEKMKGSVSAEDFNKFKTEQMDKLNEVIKSLEKAEDVAKEQGNKIGAILEKAGPEKKSFEQFIIDMAPQIKKAREEGKMIEVTATQLKAAGITSISGSVQDMTTPPGSPYAPGIGGSLEIFDIARNPNYILNKVDLGRTDQSRLAWANETSLQGAVAEVTEGQDKPLTQHIFQVEMSIVKKIAGYIKLTEEFDQDLPQFATKVRRMLQEDVIRGWDDAIQAAVIAAATAYSVASLNNKVPDANFWDALYAMRAQVLVANFIPNTFGIHPYTDVIMQTDKTSIGDYLTPSFKDLIASQMTLANKLSVDNGLVGDLKQFKVDVYKEFVLKMGLVNDDLIKNQFTIVGEIRYHRYISDARKTAIVKGNLWNISSALDAGTIAGGSSSY